MREALRLLGKQHVVLVVHDVSFPFSPGEDVGHGSPYSREACALVAYAKGLGFDAIQLGPQGRTSAANASPYDSTLFSRNEIAMSLAQLAEDPELDGLVPAKLVAELAASHTSDRYRADHAAARTAWRRMLAEAHARLGQRPQLVRELERFTRTNAGWLLPDARFDSRESGADDVAAIERYALAQLLFQRQHSAWRRWLGELGMTVWGDLQIGMAPCDAERFHELFLSGYRLGAPPSRTNPHGQPWGYPVYDPDHIDGEYARPEVSAVAFLRARAIKMAQEYDGLRIDHPHGLVCPWVYQSDQPDPQQAVQHGARLFASPSLPDHPRLARFSRVRAAQLNPDPATPRYADNWVVDLEPDQVDAYARLFDAIVEPQSGHARLEIMCEVLSTMPYPLQRVMQKHGFGRYRVTQKADPSDPDDVYRSENALPEDWIMVSNHDTPSMWALATEWSGTNRGDAEVEYLSRRLRPGEDPAPFAATLRADRGALVNAKFADALASEARGIQVFFADLFGLEETYNEPGTVGPHNWTLRVPPDWREHDEHVRAGRALDLRRALADALRARGLARAHAELITRLER